jgi:glyoxylase-like metal-dependent hydrolase (beta-lactamase superfamily II)
MDDKGGYRQINKSLNICAFDEYLKGQTARLPELASVEQLTPRVLRILGQNPGKVSCAFLQPGIMMRSVSDISLQFTFQGTNTYVVGTGRDRLIIDTSGGEPEWAELVEATLRALDINLSHVLLTHWHGDHTGGVPDLLAMYPHLENAVYKNMPDREQQDITDSQVFRVEGATLRAVHTPGHSEDHMCFVLKEEQAMFTGDNILGHGTSAVEDLGVFMTSLEKMKEQRCKTGYSAHGAPIADLDFKIAGELKQKLRREQQILRALSQAYRRGEKSVTVGKLVEDMYGRSLDAETRTLALEPLAAEVLRKMAGDGKVAFQMRGGKKRWYALDDVRR